jgi:folylpolyglutamate synthase/dihydropteroate synthase
MLDALLPRSASVALAPLPSPRALEPERLEPLIRPRVPRLSRHGSIAEALAAARDRAAPEDLLLVAGSLVLVGEARRCLLGGG